MRPGAAFSIAGRILRGRGGSGGGGGNRHFRGAVLGVALSLVPLVVVLVVADGMIDGITSRYVELGTYHLQARPYFRTGEGALAEAAKRLRGAPGLIAAYPEIQGPAIALAGSKTAGALLRAVDPGFLSDRGTEKYLRIVAGERALRSSNEVVIGESLARKLGLEVGDIVSMVTARPTGSGRSSPGFAPKVAPFKIRGIVSAGYRELDALWAFVDLKAGERILAPDSIRSLVGVKVAEPFGDLEAARRSARAALRPDWTVATWPETERNLFKSFSTTRALLLLVMALAVAVAAINVGSALIMLVLERRRDIAILKSGGADGGSLSAVFLLAGLAIGAAGTALGLALGCLAAWRINDLIAGIEAAANALGALASTLAGQPGSRAPIKLLDPSYYLERIPVRIDPGEIALVAGASLLLCVVSAILPARRAARLPPLEVFRKT